eukprot:5852555-Pleurochrysis_carterae.AAC.1
MGGDEHHRGDLSLRWNITDEVKAVLLHIFSTIQYPSADLRRRLADQFGVSSKQVQVWFRNQRQRKKNPIWTRQMQAANFNSTCGINANTNGMMYMQAGASMQNRYNPFAQGSQRQFDPVGSSPSLRCGHPPSSTGMRTGPSTAQLMPMNHELQQHAMMMTQTPP